MLALSQIPPEFTNWNIKHGAPFGHTVASWKRALMSDKQVKRLRGPFSFQVNNSIRKFEYPWAFDVAKLKPGMRVLEIGGGLAGFQFVLDHHECKVVNVDPGMTSEGWPCDENSMAKLNKMFNCQVELRNTTIDKAGLQTDDYDRIFSISVIEHLPAPAASNVMQHAHRCLKANGLFILTCDLFLNLAPFCSRQQNEFGVNQNLKSLIDETLWEIVIGDKKCLFGFEEFSTDYILGNLERFLIGHYPALAQCVVLRKK